MCCLQTPSNCLLYCDRVKLKFHMLMFNISKKSYKPNYRDKCFIMKLQFIMYLAQKSQFVMYQFYNVLIVLFYKFSINLKFRIMFLSLSFCALKLCRVWVACKSLAKENNNRTETIKKIFHDKEMELDMRASSSISLRCSFVRFVTWVLKQERSWFANTSKILEEVLIELIRQYHLVYICWPFQ